jgi:hypothetical protein
MVFIYLFDNTITIVDLGHTYATFEPMRGFTDVAALYRAKKGINSRGYTQEEERNMHRARGTTTKIYKYLIGRTM